MKKLKYLLIFTVITLPIASVLTFMMSRSAQVLVYRAILIAGPTQSRKWALEKLEDYKILGTQAISYALYDPNKKIREDAFYELRFYRKNLEVALPNLIKAFKVDDGTYRYELAELIAKLKSKALVELRKNLHHPNVHVRYRVVETLGRIGVDAFPELFLALKDQSHYVRRCAAHGLRYHRNNDELVHEKLMTAFDDKHGEVRAAVIEALGHNQKCTAMTISKMISALADQDTKVQKASIDSLTRLQPKSLSAILSALKNEEPLIRAGAAASLAARVENTQQIINKLATLLVDDCEIVRLNALRSLGEHEKDAEPVVEKILVCLLEDSQTIQAETLLSLEKIQSPKAVASVSRLIELTKSSSNVIRRRSADVLGELGPQAVNAVPRLLTMFKKDDYHYSRRMAGVALCKIAPENPQFGDDLLAVFDPQNNNTVKFQAAMAYVIYDQAKNLKTLRPRLIKLHREVCGDADYNIYRAIMRMSANDEERDAFRSLTREY